MRINMLALPSQLPMLQAPASSASWLVYHQRFMTVSSPPYHHQTTPPYPQTLELSHPLPGACTSGCCLDASSSTPQQVSSCDVKQSLNKRQVFRSTPQCETRRGRALYITIPPFPYSSNWSTHCPGCETAYRC
ncbi:hypothetical protein BDW02DRAFT_64294 [Decorospora gaudefroyi]|uniref:Uncharacterized protein n=1 Tax=Decorospora gaudefroyi TaxID=184978 RepID=A0A6A5K4F3_9PLEO|nr:hypothetical protein BDW02DRAFT_64294 [Decorospora gaudefroyi]